MTGMSVSSLINKLVKLFSCSIIFDIHNVFSSECRWSALLQCKRPHYNEGMLQTYQNPTLYSVFTIDWVLENRSFEQIHCCNCGTYWKHLLKEIATELVTAVV